MSNAKNPKVVLLPFLAVIVVLVAVAFIQTPPQEAKDDCGEDHSKEQPQVMSGKLQGIDLTKAKVVVIQPRELADQNCANEIAQSLNSLNAVGNLTVDLAKKLVTVQYDSSKVDEKRILEAFYAAKHEAMVLQSAGEQSTTRN